jgi:TonB-linked SusC/RagA family outer membrane protein
MKIQSIITAILLVFVSHMFAQTKVLTGRILDNTGESLPGANIYFENAQNRALTGTVADLNGNYKLVIPSEKNTNIVCSFIGYKTKRIPYTGQASLDITLEEDAVFLGSVEVIGEKVERNTLGITAKEQITATQTFNMENLESTPMTSIEAALQGRLANVDIVTGGDPGSRSSIRIRGTSSLNASSEPLIVIDGIPYPTTIADDFNFSTANDEDFGALVNISPADIESIEVLKDAAATAIWGSQGANGVLLFKTKKGKQGRTRFSFTSKFDYKKEPKTIPMLNASQFVSLMQDAIWNSINDIGYEQGLNYTSLLYDTKEINYDPDWIYFNNYNQDINWIDEITRTGITSDNSLSMSGGGEKATYRVSLSYAKELGTTIGTSFDRFSSLISVNYRFSDKLRINSDFSYSQSDRKSSWSDSDLDGFDSPRSEAMNKMPNMSPYIIGPDGRRTDQYFTPLRYFQGDFTKTNDYVYNPVAAVYESVNNTIGRNARVGFSLEYFILRDLQYTGTVGFDMRSTKNKKFLPQSVTGVLWVDPYFNLSSDLISDNLYLTTDNKLIYRKSFNDAHKIILTGIFQTNSSLNNNYASETSGNASISLEDPTSGASVYDMGSGTSKSRRLGMITNAHYTFKERYIISGGYRYEANSSMGKNRRWGGFPTLGIAWHFAEEGFLKDKGWMDIGKLRLSWGRSGNTPSGSYPYIGIFQPITPGYIYMDAITPATIQLDNLKWETVTQTNIGTDISMFDSRLDINIDLYSKITTDLLQKDVSLPTSTGFSKVKYYNSGKVSNKGIEFLLDYEILRNKDYGVSFNFNVSRNVNEVLDLPDNLQFESYEFGNGKYAHKIIEGNPIGSFYGYKCLGVYQNVDETYARDEQGGIVKDIYGDPVFIMNGNQKVYPGDAKYTDINGDGVIDQYDIVYIGNAMPLLNGGAGLNFRYKNWTLSTFFHGRYGQKIVNRNRINTENMYSTSNQSVAVLKRWRHEGDNTIIPRALYKRGYNYLGSDRFVEDGSFVRLKTISLKYTVPKLFLQKLKIERLDMYVTCYDLFTWTNYSGQDPEVSLSNDIYMLSVDNASTPKPIRFAFGLNMNF